MPTPAPGPTPLAPAVATAPVRLADTVALKLDRSTVERLRSVVPRVATDTVATIIREVPSYARPFSEAMGERIRAAVELALVNFLELARAGSGTDPAEPIAPSTAAAYELGRGEARSGRSMDALQAAYRVGARVSWRGLSREAVAAGVPAATLGGFAELVFAYIDALSASSIAGHADELVSAGRARERYRERLAAQLVGGAEEGELIAAARRAEWHPPRTLTAVLLPEGQLRAVLGGLDQRTLAMSTDASGDDEGVGVLLVPDAAGRDRERLLRQLDGR
ncbi:MAG: PucR family transcriptional regulator, partial [Candidatus Phosphoribacter sp.]